MSTPVTGSHLSKKRKCCLIRIKNNALTIHISLNMRTTIGVYKSLLKYLDAVDTEAQARGEGPQDKSIDPHFRSGVYLGNGAMNMILSLMPGKLQTLAELLGYKGDRQVALRLLSLPGGWTKDSAEPSVSIRTSFIIHQLALTIYTCSSQKTRVSAERFAILCSLFST